MRIRDFFKQLNKIIVSISNMHCLKSDTRDNHYWFFEIQWVWRVIKNISKNINYKPASQASR